MDYWHELMNTALLGTGKKRLDTRVLPELLQRAAENSKVSDAEAQLLQVAALATQYRRTGAGPERWTLPSLPICEKETQSYCPTPANRLLLTLLQQESPDGKLLQLWLDKCIAKGWIISPESLVKLLDAGTEKKYQPLQDKIQRVIGKRGQWLAGMHEKWKYLAAENTSPEQIWQEGRPTQRKEVFKTLREQNPGQALRWLEQTWFTESAKDRREFLELLRINLNPADEPFLQQLRDEFVSLGNKVKAIHQELNVAASRLMLFLPGSSLSKQVWEQVKSYFHLNNTQAATSGRRTVTLTLPEKEDSFFKAGYMHEQFGLDKSSPSSRYSNAEYWLGELLRFISPVCWEEYFGVKAREVLEVFIHSDPDGAFVKRVDNKAYPLYAGALADAIFSHGNAQWATAWLDLYPDWKFIQELEPKMLQLCELLPQADLEKFAMAHVSHPTAYETLFINPRLGEWSLPFTHFVLQSTRSGTGDYYQSNRNQQFMAKAVLHIPSAVLNHLDSYRKTPEGSSDYITRQWMDRIEIPLTQWLTLRQAVELL